MLLEVGRERIAFLHCYIACQTSRNDDFLTWNEDLFQLLTQETISIRQQGFRVLAMGDFNSRIGQIRGLEGNTPDVNRNGPMFTSFIEQASLVIINTLPIAKGLFTRFMRGPGQSMVTESLLDYGLIDSEHVHTVNSFVIDSDARFDCGSDHALLVAEICMTEQTPIKWEFRDGLKFNIRENTDFAPYTNYLDQQCDSLSLHNFLDVPLEEKLDYINSCMIEAGRNTIGLQTTKKRKPRQIPMVLRNKIKAKNTLAKQINADLYSSGYVDENMEARLQKLRLEISDAFGEIKMRRRLKLRSKILVKDPTRRKFWRFLKTQAKNTGAISCIYTANGQMTFQPDEIDESILQHFAKIFRGKRVPVFDDLEPRNELSEAIDEIDDLLLHLPAECPEDRFESEVCSTYTMAELNHTLDTLPNEKAAGIDSVPTEFLKHSGSKFRQYLLAFLNQVLEEGVIPEALNSGKCFLIPKV